jgi:hypothetical protein
VWRYTEDKESKIGGNMNYMNVKCSDLLSILTQEEIDWVTNIRIPYNTTGGEWYEKHRIDQLIIKALTDGVVNPIPREEVVIRKGMHVISDYIAGPGDALKSMADGKMYDSKSTYRKSLKAQGLIELGNDAPTTCKEPEYKICEKELKRDIAQAIQQLGG